MKRSQIDQAIASLERQKAAIDQAIHALRSTQTEPPKRITKPRAVTPAEKVS
jgi:hypothetical protein